MPDILFKDLTPGDIVFRLVEGKIRYSVVRKVVPYTSKRGGQRIHVVIGKRSLLNLGAQRHLSYLEYWKPELPPQEIARLRKKAGWSPAC